MSSATLIGGATAGIIYAGEKEEEEKNIKVQTIKAKPSNSNRQSNPNPHKNYTMIIQQLTTYLDENNEEATSDKIDLSDENIKKIVNIGFYQNGEGEMQAIKMPRIIEKVPDKLPPKITSTKDMFAGALSFNQNISSWDTSKITNMSGMFAGASLFNQNISSWDTSNVKDMTSMFASTESFNQDLSGWNVSKVIKHEDFATNSNINNSTIDYLPKFES